MSSVFYKTTTFSALQLGIQKEAIVRFQKVSSSSNFSPFFPPNLNVRFFYAAKRW
jgi:hypothetical protein